MSGDRPPPPVTGHRPEASAGGGARGGRPAAARSMPTAEDLLASLSDERAQPRADDADGDLLAGFAADQLSAATRSRRTCIDVGAAIGLSSGVLAGRFPTVIALDLSAEMLRLAPPEPALRVQADASRLPVADGTVDVIVLSNAFLFPAEVDRALAPDGAVVWVSSRGADTPIYLPAHEVSDALPGGWDGVASQAGWGTWSVHWRTPA